MTDAQPASAGLTRLALKKSVEELLDEGKAGALAREQTEFDRLAGPLAQRLVLFGAGGLGRKTLAGLRHLGIQPLAFADNNSALWDRTVDGVPVLSPAEAARRYGQSAAFVVTIWKARATERMAQREQQLRELGCRCVLSFGLLFWKYPDVFLPHYAVDLPHRVHEQAEAIFSTCDLWSDEASRREYLAQLRWRLHLDFGVLPDPVGHTIYFPQDLCPLVPGEVFVDCGAFDGDTIRSFLALPAPSFGKIFAFEPDPANFLGLQDNLRQCPQREAIVAFQAAVGERQGRVVFSAEGTESSALGASGIEVDCVALDDVLKGDVAPTYIKMDIEGAELDALGGARRVIAEHRPVLAICSYHRQDHLWKVPQLIRSIAPDYSFFLRPHLLEVWDLVCYAIPRHRLSRTLQSQAGEGPR